MSTNDEKTLHDKLANRQSLPVITTTASNKHSKLRHTQSHNYGSKTKKKVKTTVPEPIPEDQPIPEKPLHRENRSDHEHIRLSIISEESERKYSRKKANNAITKENHSYDNFAFEESKDNGPSSASVSRTNSNANSVQSSRNPSVQSLTVIREQYCCCARRTPCERILVASVAVLATIIVILVIVISFIASSKNKGIEETFRWKL